VEWVTGFLDGWAGFFSLTFHGDLLLMLVAGAGFAVVARAALRAPVRPLTRRIALIGALVIFGLMLAKGLRLFG
jgi:hypothetical protein